MVVFVIARGSEIIELLTLFVHMGHTNVARSLLMLIMLLLLFDYLLVLTGI